MQGGTESSDEVRLEKKFAGGTVSEDEMRMEILNYSLKPAVGCEALPYSLLPVSEDNTHSHIYVIQLRREFQRIKQINLRKDKIRDKIYPFAEQLCICPGKVGVRSKQKTTKRCCVHLVFKVFFALISGRFHVFSGIEAKQGERSCSHFVFKIFFA